MKENLVIRTQDMYVMLNYFFCSKKPAFQIDTPFLSDPLFLVSLNKAGIRLQSPYNHSAYQQEITRARKHRLEHEIPDFRSVKEILCQSGIVRYPNLDQLLLEVHQLCDRDFMMGDRPAFLGLDTNLFRDRFYTTQHDWLRMLPDNKVGISISPYVKRELLSKKKYSDRTVNRFKEAAVQGEFKKYFNEFFNQSRLEDRRRRLGHVEIRKARRLQWIILLPDLDEDELQDNPDSNIILSYQLAVQERGVDILLLSRDHDFIAQAAGIPGIQPFLVESIVVKDLNHTIDQWNHLVQLLYLLAIHFGVIRVQNRDIKIILMGVWRGKTDHEWSRECLKLVLPEMDTPEITLWQNLDILQKMNWPYE